MDRTNVVSLEAARDRHPARPWRHPRRTPAPVGSGLAGLPTTTAAERERLLSVERLAAAQRLADRSRR